MSLRDLFFDKVIDNVLCTAVVLGWDSYPGGSYVSYFHDLSFSCCWSDSFSKNSTYFCCNALRTATRRMRCRKPGLIGIEKGQSKNERHGIMIHNELHI